MEIEFLLNYFSPKKVQSLLCFQKIPSEKGHKSRCIPPYEQKTNEGTRVTEQVGTPVQFLLFIFQQKPSDDKSNDTVRLLVPVIYTFR